MDKHKADKIISALAAAYPDARPALEFSSPYELLVAVILSAQCTDKRVNIVTKELFKDYNTPEKMLTLSVGELGEKIKSCGLYRSKAAHILSASRDIVEKFGGKVPETQKELKTLAGVGQKTANVVYAVAFGGEAIAVDTHVFRVSNRLGLAESDNVTDTEKSLNRLIDRHLWSKAHHYLIYHGRQVCKAIKPDCENCCVSSLCEKHGLKKKASGKTKADKSVSTQKNTKKENRSKD